MAAPDEDDVLKLVASDLVGALRDSDASHMIAPLGLASMPPPRGGLVSPKPGWVGIWRSTQKAEHGVSFERSEDHAGEWHLWADVAVIPPKSSRLRVVYIGESTARGYFYDPAFNPAAVLQQMLHRGGLANGVEVIDLARSDLGFEGDLVALLDAAQALEPDAYVIFSGNNRKLPHSALKSPPSRPAMLAAVLRDHGIVGLRSVTETWREHEARTIVDAIAGLDQPALVILPEFNLGSWHNETSGDVPWLTGKGNERWFMLRDRARHALRSGDLEQARNDALQMLALDGGTACSGLAIITECMRAEGRVTEARAFAQRARDAHMGWDFGSPQTPRLDTATKTALSRGLEAAGVALVDSSQVFEHYLQGELPDRRLFLDYCHLTSEGIRVTMAATTQRLLPLLGQPGTSQDALLRTVPLCPTPEVEAQARFAAAIHNAHWGQPFDVVHDHCAHAVRLAPRLTQVMREYLEMAVCRTPNWMCRGMESLLRADCPALAKYVLGYGAVSLLDSVLTDAIAKATEPAHPGTTASLAELRKREYGLVPGALEDLLASGYAPSFMDREWAHSGLRGAVESDARPVVKFVAHSPSSRFVFVCDGDRPVRVAMTGRLVDARGANDPVRIRVNGFLSHELALTDDWRSTQFSVPSSALRDGLNDLEIEWPADLEDGDHAIAIVARKTERKLGSARFLPTYGSIFSLTATIDEQGLL